MTPDLLKLTQWLSPAFPVGGFAYSHGLEQAIEAGHVRDAASLQSWLLALLRLGTGRMDAALIGRAMVGEDVADLARALAASKERLEEAEAQGTAFAQTVSALLPSAVAPASLPVAVGVAARQLSLPPEQVAALYLHAFTANLVSAGVRFIPLGQTAGQQVLAALHEEITRIATEAVTRDPLSFGSAVQGADMAAMKHETQEVRLFKS
ncbi:urease accessory protein UreF [Pseudoruegeria sp. SHC-113]|uniref:urease accessory protein UreF n=1 Tax=Pseudoruegeria sp. SHC-113 TaxID=2855439 RepID=UPI0021BA6983|nr:urease accessory UreF family protein [Pseudoruegeria sp. SHC-113]MCT8160251.1 urease accessory protein UreF [Pseudoruegeria sp. SHC-113]